MPVFIGRDREVRRCYGFDEIALVPGNITVDPEDVDVSVSLGDIELPIPFLASAMDGVVDVPFAVAMGKLGGLAVLNLDGINTRYEKPKEVLDRIASASPEEATTLVQEVYREPVKKKLIGQRVAEIKKAKVNCAVSTIPQCADEYGPIAQEAGCDAFFVQSTVTTVRHKSTKHKAFDVANFCKKKMKIPVVIGNTVGYDVSLELMEAGIAGLLVGVGPGAACTTRGVLGLGVPQVTATIDCAAARDFIYKKSGRYIPIITDGGMNIGGDVCKAFACGSDAVMIGSAFARTKEAPGQGFHWGMATPHANLPRGTRIRVGVTGSTRYCSGPRASTTAPRTSSGPCGPAWELSAPRPSRRCTWPRSSSRPPYRRKGNYSKRRKR